MYKLLYFMAFFGYLNVLSYEVKYCNLFESKPITSSETLLEVFLEDILEVNHNHDKEQMPEIMFDDYRIIVLGLFVLPIILYFSWLLRRIIASNDRVRHPIYYLRRIILPGYYNFLYRYRPF